MYKFANVQHFVFYCTIVKIISWYNSQTLWNIYFCKIMENFIILHSEIRDIHRSVSDVDYFFRARMLMHVALRNQRHPPQKNDVDDFCVICFKGKKLLFGLGELRRYYAKVNKGCINFQVAEKQRSISSYALILTLFFFMAKKDCLTP